MSARVVLAVRVAVLALWPVDGYAIQCHALVAARHRFALRTLNGAVGHYALAGHIEQAWKRFISGTDDDAFHLIGHEGFTADLPPWPWLRSCPVARQKPVGAPTLMETIFGDLAALISLRHVFAASVRCGAVDAVAGKQNGVGVGVIAEGEMQGVVVVLVDVECVL